MAHASVVSAFAQCDCGGDSDIRNVEFGELEHVTVSISPTVGVAGSTTEIDDDTEGQETTAAAAAAPATPTLRYGLAQPCGLERQENGGGVVLDVGVCVGVGVGVAVMEADADTVIETALDTVLAGEGLAGAVTEPDSDVNEDADAVTVRDVERDSVGDGAAEKEVWDAVGVLDDMPENEGADAVGVQVALEETVGADAVGVFDASDEFDGAHETDAVAVDVKDAEPEYETDIEDVVDSVDEADLDSDDVAELDSVLTTHSDEFAGAV